MGFELGSKVGDYQFIDVLESTREETTYKVRNLPAQRFELLRVLGDAVQGDRLRAERFQREANILARLKHPHIVSYRASTKLDGRMVLATELVEGSNLAERLEVGRISLPDAVRIIWQTLEALECAHAQGVIHRDISPQKIFLTPEGEVKLGGFFLARSVADPKLTQAGAAIGSAHYMSPEQVQAVEDLDIRADLYSLGVVFYELVTGRKPFQGGSQFDVMLAQVETEPLPPSHYEKQLSQELDALILRALAKKREERYQSAAEFREALMGVHLGSGTEALPDLESVLERQRKQARQAEEESAQREKAFAAEEPELAAQLHPGSAAPPPSRMSKQARIALFAVITFFACSMFLWMSNYR